MQVVLQTFEGVVLPTLDAQGRASHHARQKGLRIEFASYGCGSMLVTYTLHRIPTAGTSDIQCATVNSR